MHSFGIIAPVGGWALDLVVALDAYSAGFAGSYLRSSDERRHVIAAMLSARPLFRDAHEARELAKFITAANHDDLLAAVYDPVPVGLRRVLSKCGSQPYPRQFYRELHRLFSSPENRRIVDVIGQLATIDHRQIAIIKALPEDLLSANLVKIIESVTVAADVTAMVNLLTGRGADREGLSRAIRAVSSAEQFAKFWERWAFKATFPEHPITASPCYLPVRDGNELRKISVRYRNCAKRYLIHALEGSSAFAEFTDAGSGVVVHLERHEGTWFVEGIFARDNGPVRPLLRQIAINYLASEGVRERAQYRETCGEWDVLRRLTRSRILDMD